MIRNAVKKLSLFLLTLAMLFETVAVSIIAAPSDGVTVYSAEIMKVKGGRDAIATVTLDDGLSATANTAEAILSEYGFPATLMVVPYRIDGYLGSGYATLAELQALTADGTLEVQSHSYSHMYIAPPNSADYNPDNCTAENIQNEIIGSYNYLTEKFPNQHQIVFAVPGGSYNDEAIGAVMKTFYAARYKSGRTDIPQTLTPVESADVGGWYNLRTEWLSVRGETAKMNEVLSYLDTCVRSGGWFLSGAHNITDNINGSNDDMTTADFRVLLDAFKKYSDEGKLWVASFSDAVKYLREYESSTVKQYFNDRGMFLEVEMNGKTPGGLPLPSDVFNMPLTVKAEIPDGWKSVRARIGGAENYYKSFTEGGKTFAYIDVVPNCGSVYLSDGDEEIPREKVNATLEKAKGGANAIATLTFDDGRIKTAEILNELCEKYGIKASLMLIANRIPYEAEAWHNIFSKGYLEPQNHSYSHAYLVASTNSAYVPENDNYETRYREIVTSKELIESTFTGFDCLGYSIPYSNYASEAFEILMSSHYMASTGKCVINPDYGGGKGNMMSLDPKPDQRAGGWYNPYSIRLADYSNSSVYNADNITAYLKKCVDSGGWFYSLCHGIEPDGNTDLSSETAEALFSAMSNYQKAGKLWVATVSEAVKYIRERQNSTVTAYSTVDGIYVGLTMAEYTSDGLPLPEDIFNMPLTVKVELPSDWGRITYRQANGEEKAVNSFEEGGVRFAYVDLVPNGGMAYIEHSGDPTEYVKTLGMKQSVSANISLTYNIYIPESSFVESVFVENDKLTATEAISGMTKYSVGDIDIMDVNREYEFKLVFTEESGLSDYKFKRSVTQYFDDLVNTNGVTDDEKQLSFDFLTYARASLVRFAPEGSSVNTVLIDEILESMGGCSPSTTDAPKEDIGEIGAVIKGITFAINEKPYYLFYIRDGFTGTLRVTASDSSAEYEIVNGFYHCTHQVIHEVMSVASLADTITVTIEGRIGERSVSITGNYSLVNYVEGTDSDYSRAIMAYALSAYRYSNCVGD